MRDPYGLFVILFIGTLLTIVVVSIINTVYGTVTVRVIPLDGVLIPENKTEIKPETCITVFVNDSYRCMEGSLK